MQNPIRRSIVVIALLALSTPLAACSGSAVKPGPTKTVYRTVTATPTTNESSPEDGSIPAPPTADTQKENLRAGKEALAYLTSHGRDVQFKRIVPKAGIKIAQALQAGKFGKVKRYNANKVMLQPGESGPGGISSMDNSAFAWVYWKSDGSIDYSKPITQVSLGDKKHNNDVAIFDPAGMGYWTVFMDVGKQTETDPLLTRDNPELDPARAKYGQFFNPTDVGGIATLDTRALNQFLANMEYWFGPTWNK